jgi:hypothetical protein
MDPVLSPKIQRFVVTMPALGLSRIAVPPSTGRHFSPQFNVSNDFAPEDDRERQVVAIYSEAAHLHVGLFVFGRAILDSDLKKWAIEP